MTERPNDNEMNDDELSAQYREAARELPSPATDERLLAAARSAVQPAQAPRRRDLPWGTGLAAAAVVVLSATLVLRGPEREPPAVPAAVPTAGDGSIAPDADRQAGAVASPEALGASRKTADAHAQDLELASDRPARESGAPPEALTAKPSAPRPPAGDAGSAQSLAAEARQSLQGNDDDPLRAAARSLRDFSAAGRERPTAESALEEIGAEWEAGDEALARELLRKFRADYPDFPEDELEARLPQGLRDDATASRVNQ